MASPLRLKGYNTVLDYAATNVGIGGQNSATPLTSLTKIKFPNAKRSITNTFDIDTVGAVTGQTQVKTSQPGWIDCDKIDVTAYFTQAQYSALLTLFNNGTEYYWLATLPLAAGQVSLGAQLYWPGYVSEISVDEINTDDDNLIMVPFSIKVNDVVEFASGS